MTDKLSANQFTLYFSGTCPYCHRVLDALDEMGLTPDTANGTAGEITLKNTKNSEFKEELITGGGKKTVPCLAIERNGAVEWMYESLDIIDFLKLHLV